MAPLNQIIMRSLDEDEFYLCQRLCYFKEVIVQ